MRPGQGSGLWYKSRAQVQALQFSGAHVPPGARAQRVWTPLPGWGPLACGWGLGVGQKGPLNSTHLGALMAEVGTPMSQPTKGKLPVVHSLCHMGLTKHLPQWAP